MKHITSETIKPPKHTFYGEYTERGVDPWHADAFPSEFQAFAPHKKNPRAKGWWLIDGAGNGIDFVPDGTEYETGN